MTKADELIDKLTKLDLPQISDWEESIPEEIWFAEFDKKHTVLAEGLEVNKHRWYETSTTAIQFEDGSIMGINSVTNIYSENMMFEDCGADLSFFPMSEVKVISYVRV